MRKYIIVLLLVCLSASLSYAQTIICEKQGSTAAQLGEGNAAVSFVSTQSDWVIKPIKGDTEQPRSKTSDGKKYIYEFQMNVSKDHERTYILGRKGSAITDQCVVKSLRPGIRVTFNLEEQADTLNRIEAKLSSSTGVYPVEGKACVEITTSVKQLEVMTGWPKEETISANGAKIINIFVDVQQLNRMEAKRDSLSAVMKRLEDADDYENMEGVMNTINKLEDDYDALAELTIGGQGIKGVPIQLTDLSVKEKRRYAVISISETFESLLAHARDMYAEYPLHTDYNYYEAARIAYEKAINHNDCPHELREAIRAEQDTILSLRRKTFAIEKAAARVQKYEAEKGFESDEVFKYLGGQINVINMILKYHPEISQFVTIKQSLIERAQKHPQGKTLDGYESVTHQREKISGTISFKNEYMSIPFNKLRVYASTTKNIQDSKSRIICKVNDDGTYSAVKPEGMDPLYIYVTGEKNEAHFVPSGTTQMDIVIK